MDSTRTPLLRRWRWLIAGALTLAAVGGVVGYAAAQPPHRPTARVYVSFSPVSSVTEDEKAATESFAAVAKTPIVLQPVIAKLDLHVTPAQLAERMTAVNEKDTALIDISVSSGSQVDSARIANEVGRQLVAVAPSLTPNHSGTTVRLALVEVARPSA